MTNPLWNYEEEGEREDYRQLPAYKKYCYAVLKIIPTKLCTTRVIKERLGAKKDPRFPLITVLESLEAWREIETEDKVLFTRYRRHKTSMGEKVSAYNKFNIGNPKVEEAAVI